MDPEVAGRVKEEITSHGLRVLQEELDLPWGGRFVIDSTQIEEYAAIYFPQMKLPRREDRLPMQPRFLMVAPGKRTSWQYHTRRAEEWRVIEGPVGAERAMTDQEPDPQAMQAGSTLRLATGERHRLCGLENWGIVAEIWVHTDATSPSDEDDIVRVQDDYGRGNPTPKPEPRFYT